MKKKNLIIYLLFIFVILIVPRKVNAAYEYELNSPCHDVESSDFWVFKNCQVDPYAVTEESKGFQFTEDNSHIYTGKVTISYKDNLKYVCSRRTPNDDKVILSATVCDVYYIQKKYSASCVYQADNGKVMKVLIDTSNTDIFRVQLNDKSSYKDALATNLNFETFQYDGDCPSSVKATASPSDRGYLTSVVDFRHGDSWINIKESSTNKVTNPACTSDQIESFKAEEEELFKEWESSIKDKYVKKIKNKEFSQYTTTAEQKISELEAYLTVPVSNLEKVYTKKVEALMEKYSCTGLPTIDRKSNADYSELDAAYRQALEELRQEAINNGDTESAAVYSKYIEEEMDTFLDEKEEKFKYIFETLLVNWNFGENIKKNCEGVLGTKLIEHIQLVFDWIKIIAPILLILFGSLDFAKAVIANDNDAMKKATNNFVKRAIAAIAIFFLPLLISLVFNMPGIKEKLTLSEDPLCNISWVVKK